jgi:putative MATE family efflux protein
MSQIQNDTRNILDDDRIGRLLFKLALPSFMGMFVMTLYNIVDTIFIGRYVGPLGIAGLSIVFPVQMLSMGIGHMTGMGGASLISRLIGANKIERAERALGNSITLTIIMSALITIVGLSNTDFWLRLIGSSDTILPYARDYMTIILIGMFFQTSAMTMNFLIRAEGNARVPMIGMIIGAGSNIVLDAIFIIPLGMGIKGAALATVIAQIISVGYFITYYMGGRNFLKIRMKNLALELDILKGILAIGIASFAMTIAGSLSAILVNRVLISHGGDIAISAFGVINRIMMFALMPGIVCGQGLQPILGYNYGAQRYDRALKAIKIATIAATSLNMLSFLLLYFTPQTFIGIFTSDSELISIGAYAAKRIWIVMYIIGSMMVGSIVFQAMGKAVQSFITAIARPALFLIPTILIMPRYMGIDGVWWAFPLTDGLTFIVTVALLIPQINQLRRAHKQTIDGQPVTIGQSPPGFTGENELKKQLYSD